ncbi:MAG: hypothetical protein RBT72_07610 [Spirochaetia bacterium]|jgi:hypothetical protein|nr:hypothetical protein [Spirochaetia bacterium]
MKKILIILVAFVLLAAGIGAQSIDSISKASTSNYYTKTSLTGEDLWKALETYQLSVSVATVNPDGSPNAAVVIPGVTKDRQHLFFGLAPNQTGINMKERKLIVVTATGYIAPKGDQKMTYSGARIIAEYVSDPAIQKKLVEQNKDKKASDSTIFLKIVKVLPIG